MLLLDRNELEVRHIDGALALYAEGQRCGTVPLKLVDRVVIQGAHTHLESGVLLKLAEAGIATLLLSPRMSRQVAILLGPTHNEAAIRLAQGRRTFDHTFCIRWARPLVISKLRRQRKLIATAASIRLDLRHTLREAAAGIDSALAEITADPDITAPRLRGLEGSAARAYFRAYTALYPAELGFTGRNRRPPRDPVNACLSLGYTLLHFDAVRAAHMLGLDPLLGFYHRPAIGRESLACDLIEPLRPVVDTWLAEQFHERLLRAEHFSHTGNACLMGKAGRAHFYAAWSRFAPLPQRWLRRRCSSLARLLRSEGEPLLEHFEDDDEYF